MTSGMKPPARDYHATCILTGNHIHLAVIGGYGGSGIVFSDMWLLDMTYGSWSEVIKRVSRLYVDRILIHLVSYAH